ncbi:MAG: crosslink repair DNA glycosylase YcaQ family protein [Acidobacteriaceae bacterium]
MKKRNRGAIHGRKAIIDTVNLAGREMGTCSVMFHSAMAEKFGLSVTDWRAWDIVMRHGPFTAGDFARWTGLTPGAVTGLIDRLVEAGAVKRVRDSEDRRKVVVQAILKPSDQQTANSLFGPMLQATGKLYAEYSDNQLRTVADFMTRMSVLLREQTAALQQRRP